MFILGKAFCASHCTKVAELGYPTDLKEFLRSCSNRNQTVDPKDYSKPMKQCVGEELKIIAKKWKDPPSPFKQLLKHKGHRIYCGTQHLEIEGILF